MNKNIILLEESGNWGKALKLLKLDILKESYSDQKNYHVLGRLYQRLGKLNSARRAYLKVIELNPISPRTINNLLLLELNLFNVKKANNWLELGMKLSEITVNEKELLYSSACELKLFELKHLEALELIEKQINLNPSIMAYSNQAVCLQKLNRIDESIEAQIKGIDLLLNSILENYSGLNLTHLIGKSIGDLESSMRLQTSLMNLGILKLCKDNFNKDGLKLIQAGMSTNEDYWRIRERSLSIWKGEKTNKLVLWDDQGYGDSIQNFAWIDSACKKAIEVELWLRKSLIPLVINRVNLPKNCIVKELNKSMFKNLNASKHLGLFFLPFVLGEWNSSGLNSYSGIIQKNQSGNSYKPKLKIGLIWSAGKHSSPQPERSARIRDIPFKDLWEIVEGLKLKYNIELISMQLSGHNKSIIKEKINSGLLLRPLDSTDWLETAKVLDSIDLLISVDTSVAHLAGSMGIPCILMLSCPADWRWGQKGTKTFIYKSFCLCRCDSPGNWENAKLNALAFSEIILSKKSLSK
tara:strand:+ start:446 stop:2017 length:1572 start_codon:yes stop_codon:yes gene_type:complete